MIVYNSTMYNNTCIHIKYVKLASVNCCKLFAVVGKGVSGLFSGMGRNGGSERAVQCSREEEDEIKSRYIGRITYDRYEECYVHTCMLKN